MNIEIDLAGVKVKLALRLPETKKYFDGFITHENCEEWDVRVECEDYENCPPICPDGVLNPFSEMYLLMPRVSAYLLQFQCVLIHGVSFVWNKHAWLITAPSETGKTTQLRHWQRLWPEEISVINGDKSVLSLREDGRLWLFPSPWMGKEKDFGSAAAPLAGIIVLEQSDHNEIRSIQPRESVLRIFLQFLNLCNDPAEVKAIAGLESRLLETTPIWLLKNLGDEDSARLTRQTIADYEVKNHESF